LKELYSKKRKRNTESSTKRCGERGGKNGLFLSRWRKEKGWLKGEEEETKGS